MKNQRTALTELFTVAAATFMGISAQGAITINFGAADLRLAGGTDFVPVNGLVIIEASTLDSTFNAPTPSGFVSGDDIEIARGSVNPAGQLTLAANGLTLSGNWTTGDPLQIEWFPSLTIGATAPPAGTSYGAFRTDTVQAQSPGDTSAIAWVTPADGGTYSLSFITASQGGPNLDSTGYANLIVAVPEPSVCAMAFGLLCMTGAAIRQWRKKCV